MATKPKNKIRLELVEPEHMVALAAALQTGAEKYGRRGYMEEDVDSITGALLRHLTKVRTGEYKDRESGLPHTWHVLASAAILVSLSEGFEINDALHDEGPVGPYVPPVSEGAVAGPLDQKAVDEMTKRIIEKSLQRKADEVVDAIPIEELMNTKNPDPDSGPLPDFDTKLVLGKCRVCKTDIWHQAGKVENGTAVCSGCERLEHDETEKEKEDA